MSEASKHKADGAHKPRAGALGFTFLGTVHKSASHSGKQKSALGEWFAKRFDTHASLGLSTKEQMFLVKRLAFLIKANVPILEGLEMLSEQSTSSRYKKVIAKVIQDVANGQTLAKSFAKFPKVFGGFGVNIIKIGESSGTLSQNLDYLAEELKKRQLLKQKVMSAFIYPGVIAVACIGITAFLVLFLFPKIMPVFVSMHAKLPLSTQILIGITLFLQRWGLWLLAGIVIFVIAVGIALQRSKSFRYFFDMCLLRIPVMGGVIRNYNLANLSRTLGLLLRSGLTLSAAIPLTADTTQNLVYEKALRELAVSVNKGELISAHLKKKRFLFSDIMMHMVGVGEKTGNLSNTLVYLADLYETEIEDFTKNMSSIIEPVLMVTMGVIVGFIAISIITPIYGITQSIHP